MKYFGGCDVGSTYTKAVIMDENGKVLAHTTIKSKINAALSAEAAMNEVVAQVPELKGDVKNLSYLVGTGYGRNKVATADENISEISCHAMGVHITDSSVKAIIDIGGQDIKGIAIDTDGTVKNFAMNDKCAAGTGRFFEAMARSFELSLSDFSKLSLKAKNVIPISAQCTVLRNPRLSLSSVKASLWTKSRQASRCRLQRDASSWQRKRAQRTASRFRAAAQRTTDSNKR